MEKGGDIGMMGKGFHSSELIEKQSRKVVEIPLYKRIGLTVKQFNDDDIIKPHEREFVRKFTKLGHRIKWIVRDKTAKDGVGYLPTNDFIWRDKEWELKKPQKKKYCNAKRLIKKGRESDKQNYILDYGNALLSEKVAKQLSLYNVRNKKKTITRLFVVDREGLKEIVLRKQEVRRLPPT
ncbi:MAG: hypothetical protein ACOX0R_03210 [Candidatus Dojkabacteria bacterium]|jgi:hypothetical protein